MPAAKQNSHRIRIRRSESSYAVEFGSGRLHACGDWARSSLGGDARRIVLFSNKTVLGFYGEVVASSLRKAGFEVSVFQMGDGERFKTLATVEKALAAFAEARLVRSDAVIALGGGVAGDTAAFAASIYLRGVRVLQIPTTLLAMVDSSVGGKTGVNSAAGKNSIGTFYQPSGVLVDVDVLATLSHRHVNAGLFEAVKHSVLAGGKVMHSTREAIESRSREALLRTIRESVAFKAQIVRGDESESSDNDTTASRKILNFGHTFAHALEKAANYRHFLHGEAVGYGIAYAAEISKSLDLMSQESVKLLYDVVRSVGKLPPLDVIEPRDVFEAFVFDKKIKFGRLRMVLLEDIARPVIREVEKLSFATHAAAFRRLKEELN